MCVSPPRLRLTIPGLSDAERSISSELAHKLKRAALPTYLLQNGVDLVVEMVLRPQIDRLALVQLLLVLIQTIVFEDVNVGRNSSDHFVVYVYALELKLQTLLVLGQVFLAKKKRGSLD